MALTLSEIQALTNDYYDGRSATDIYFTENVLLWKLLGKGGLEMSLVKGNNIVDGGEKIREFLEYGKSNGGTYTASTTMSTTKTAILNAARFDWAGEYADNVIDLDDKVQNSGKAAMVDLVMAKLDNIQKTIRDNMGSKVYASGGSGAINGLGDLFNTTTSTAYGSIAEADMALWKANVITTARSIDYAVVQEIWRTASVGQTRSKKPNLGITTEVLKDAYERVLQVQQRFSDKAMVEAGFDNILHKGAPIVADDNQASGVFDALNLEFLRLRTHKDYNFTKPVWRPVAETNPDKLMADTRWVGNLTCKNRKAHCRHTNLTA